MKHLTLLLILLISFNSKSSAQCHPDDYAALQGFYNSVANPSILDAMGGWSIFQGPIVGTCDLSTLGNVFLDPVSGRVNFLNLNGYNLGGTLHPDLGLLDGLVILRLANNDFTGPIPSGIWALPNMVQFQAQNNQLSGTLPAVMGNPLNWEDIGLENNNLSGSITSAFCNLPNLQKLDFSSNNFSGMIPTCIGNNINLLTLGFNFNSLSGPLPSTFGNLVNLTQLRLRDNDLTGSIPQSWSNLTNLTNLLLDDNQLSGCYHPDLVSLCPPNFGSPQISAGNNFAATWDDFCNLGSGACVVQNCTGSVNVNICSNDGDIYVDNFCNGIIMTAPDGSCYRILMQNGGMLSTELVPCP